MAEIKTIYPYTDEESDLLFHVIRTEPKGFWVRRPAKDGGWINNLEGVRRVLYRLPEVIAADEVFVVEGERDVETLRDWGLTATCNPGGAGKWRDEYSTVLAGKKIVIIPDKDPPGQAHAKAAAESIAPHAAEVKLLPPFPNAKDSTEWVEKGGTKKALLEIVEKTNPLEFSDDRDSDPAAQAPIRVGDWREEPLRGELVVRLHEAIYEDYLILPDPGLPLVLALWDIGTNLFDVFDCFPYLCISSPVKRCAKTRLAEILEALCARAFLNVNTSEAALFRKIAKDRPTLILDEAETLRNKTSERAQYLLSILQAGFRKGAVVPRCVGRSNELEEFDVFCPKVVVAIGNLPDTLMDRSILILMQRKNKTAKVEKYRLRKMKEQAAVPANSAAVWAEKHRGAVEKAYLRLDLDFLQDREADVWEPLFAIALVAAPNRVDELKQIALRLSGEKTKLDVDDAQSVRLIADLRTVFEGTKHKKITTDQLIFKLQALPESRWDELTAVRLARILRPFEISPKQIWTGGTNVRGYDYEDFKSVFDRYLPDVTR